MNETTVLVLLAAVTVAFIAALASALVRRAARRRDLELEQHFGAEYDISLDELGAAARTDQVRSQRNRLRELSASNRERFATSWHQIQARFVDDPALAVSSANDLINHLMRARGYHTEHFEQCFADLSSGHPTVVEHYRAAHLLVRSAHNGTIDTERLRQAVVHYRALFADLLQEGREQPIHFHHAHAH